MTNTCDTSPIVWMTWDFAMQPSLLSSQTLHFWETSGWTTYPESKTKRIPCCHSSGQSCPGESGPIPRRAFRRAWEWDLTSRCTRLRFPRLRLSACMLISHKGHTDTIQVYSVTVMTHVKALQAGHSSQGTSEPITPGQLCTEEMTAWDSFSHP